MTYVHICFSLVMIAGALCFATSMYVALFLAATINCKEKR